MDLNHLPTGKDTRQLTANVWDNLYSFRRSTAQLSSFQKIN